MYTFCLEEGRKETKAVLYTWVMFSSMGQRHPSAPIKLNYGSVSIGTKNNGKKTSVLSHPYSQMNATTTQKRARVKACTGQRCPYRNSYNM